MNQYYFETKEFGVSDQGFHRLRNRFNYETIAFDQVKTVTITEGREVDNWLLLLFIGLGLLFFVVYYVTRLFTVMNDNERDVIYIEYIVVPVIPFIMGLYLIYVSVKIGPVLSIITQQNKHIRLPLKLLVKESRQEEFGQFLKDKLHDKSI